ncbi:MAG: ABC transporter substrate-binding protein [Blautia sp.]|nr:ABC transporter substrate-binding protein [Blautia sp.]
MKKTVMLLSLIGMTLAAGISVQAATEYPLTLENYGRTLTFEKAPEKVVVVGPNVREVMAACGLSDLVIGTCNNNSAMIPLPEYEEEYFAMPELTFGDPTIEAVVGSGADFVYMPYDGLDDTFSLETMAENGINVYVSSATNTEDMYRELQEVGQIFDIEDTMNGYIDEQKELVESVKAAVAEEEPKTIFCFSMDGGDGTLYTSGARVLEPELVSIAGGKHAFADVDAAWAPVSPEEVLAADPAAIVIHQYSTDETEIENKKERITSDPVLSGLTCVQEENFIIVQLPDLMPGLRTARYVETVAKALHPDCFEETGE